VDADRFDTLARALHTTPTRRLTLRALSVLGVVSLLGREAAEAGKRGKKHGGGKKKNKKKNNNNSSGTCRENGQPCTSGCNPDGLTQQSIPCDTCCSKTCGWDWQASLNYCCVKTGDPCPGCGPDQDCPKCCGSKYCTSNGTCF